MKNMKRSVRRHHYARLKKKWYSKFKYGWYTDKIVDDEEWLDYVSGLHSRTQTLCSSCLGHLNPRVYEGPTLQEVRNELSYKDQLKDIGV